MKIKILISSIISLLLLSSCQPSQMRVYDTEVFKPELVKKVVLMPSNSYLIASEDNVVDLYPMCYIENEGRMTALPPYAINENAFDFVDEAGNNVSRYFSTTDQSLVGKTLKFKATMKGGKKLESNWASVTIVAPQDDSNLETITIPVIFHLYQTAFEIKDRGVTLDYGFFTNEINRLNNAFSYKNIKNATGVNTKIIFKMAQYDPKGIELTEHGLQRITVTENNIGALLSKDLGDSLILANNAIWDPNKYLNIEVFSDPTTFRRDTIQDPPSETGQQHDSFYKYEGPRYVETSAIVDEYPKGLSLEPYNSQDLNPSDQCIKVIFSNMIAVSRGFDAQSRTAKYLPFYVGHFFGLLPTYSTSKIGASTDNDVDFCPLTQPFNDSGAVGYIGNQTQYKENDFNFFIGQNIMDDQTSFPISLSKDQNERIRWILNHGIARQPWRSDFAFTGKE